jgi:cell division protein FtsQ
VQNSYGETWFIDSTGAKIPYSGNFSADVLAANGFIHEKYQDSARVYSGVMKQLLKVANFIKNHPFWNQQFEQCYVDNFGDIILIPRVGKHSIVIGSPENLAEKMENLRIFYIKALKNLGWDKYSVINLKYKNQIVGERSGQQTVQPETKHVQNPTH